MTKEDYAQLQAGDQVYCAEGFDEGFVLCTVAAVLPPAPDGDNVVVTDETGRHLFVRADECHHYRADSIRAQIAAQLENAKAILADAERFLASQTNFYKGEVASHKAEVERLTRKLAEVEE